MIGDSQVSRREHSGRILVLGDNDLASLAIVRSLGRAGLHIDLAVWESRPWTRLSRYVRQRLSLGNPTETPAEFRRRLKDRIANTQYDLVVPVSDKSIVNLVAHKEELERYCQIALPDETGFAVTNDKARTLSLGARVGFRVPHSELVRSSDVHKDVDPRHLKFPLVLKPISSYVAAGQTRNDVRVVRTEAEYRQRLPDLLDRTPVLVQEYCAGHGVGLNVLADRGQVLAACQQERVHEPPSGGVSTYRKTMPLNRELLAAAKRFCGEIKWTGPAMFEFRAAGPGEPEFLMEVNGRFWGSLALAIAAGVNFPVLLYELLVLGKRREVFEYRCPFFVRHTRRDLPWVAANYRTPSDCDELIKVPLLRLGAEVKNVLLLRERWDLEALDDPMPAIAAWATFPTEVAGFLQRKLIRRHYWRIAIRRKREVIKGRLPERFRSVSRLLILCYGNINRSPFAAARLRTWLGETHVAVDSAGFHPRVGRPTTAISAAVAAEFGIELEGHKSRLVDSHTLEAADLILVMEPDHLRRLAEIAPDALQKTLLLSSFDQLDDSLSIEDPYAQDHGVYRQVYERIDRSTARLAENWRRERIPATSIPPA